MDGDSVDGIDFAVVVAWCFTVAFEGEVLTVVGGVMLAYNL